MKGIKNSFKSRKFKMGGYQTLIMVIVIILVIGLNLVVNKMNIILCRLYYRHCFRNLYVYQV